MRRHLVLLMAGAIMAGAGSASASGWTLEAGLVPAVYFPVGSGSDQNYASGGVSGSVSYEIEHWGFGVRVMGSLSNHTDFHISAGAFDLQGELMRRQYGLEAFSRFFPLDSEGRKRYYVELGFMANETDFVHQGSVYILSESPDYTRLFLRGGGFSIGAGYRPVNGPFFFQLNYMLTHYENLEVVGLQKFLHPILANPALNYNYFIHTVFITVGLDVFGR